MDRYEFAFLHFSIEDGYRKVWFGPHQNVTEAKESFQVRYGYWPETNAGVRVWHSYNADMDALNERDRQNGFPGGH